jgi:hypothetical protein
MVRRGTRISETVSRAFRSLEVNNLLFLLRVPPKLQGVPGESWELSVSGLGKLLDISIDSARKCLSVVVRGEGESSSSF